MNTLEYPTDKDFDNFDTAATAAATENKVEKHRISSLKDSKLPVFVRYKGLKECKNDRSKQYHAFTLIYKNL